MSVEMRVDTSDTQKALVRAALSAPKEFGRALREVGEAVKLESMKRTPVDTGVLRGSHVVKGPTGVGVERQVKVEVGGPAAGYALYVHEGFGKHKVGERKFLENAANAISPQFERLLKEALERIG